MKAVPLYRTSDKNRQLKASKTADYRSDFRRDYARLVHSPAFRRLQGKTQLFPGAESDFFRNRLTHSLEVAQIAKGIAQRLNFTDKYFKNYNIDTDLVETAALAHDLGHPPFGHNGEYALDECMRRYGGFEGNAQTLRILASLGKKEVSTAKGAKPVGLNFTHRTLGAVLKYDRVIPKEREDNQGLVKGFYKSEEAIINAAKESILGGKDIPEKFKTIECEIMDIADDIAYSTYDLEDALKAGFVTPLEILQSAYNKEFLKKIAAKVKAGAGIDLTEADVNTIYLSTFGGFIVDTLKGVDAKDPVELIRRVVNIYASSNRLASDGHARTAFTSQLVSEFVEGVGVEVNHEHPALSKIKVKDETRAKIEVLKHFTYETLIMSPRLKLVEYRGRDIVRSLFQALTSEERSGYLLLPDDCRHAYESLKDIAERKRLVCDFIAGMTDKYAIEFYARLTSVESGQSFFKPL